MSLTAKGRATRARIVEGAAEVVRDLGVAAATLDDVRARTGTSKSQLFHYFPGGKEDLLLAVAQQGEFCPLGSLFLHAGYVTPAARAVVAGLLRRWQASIAAGIRALQAAGELPEAIEVDQVAAALLAGIQGGVTIMLATGDSAQLRAALDWGIARLRDQGQAQPAASAAQLRTAGR